MNELHEFTMKSRCAVFLRNEIREMLKHMNLDEDTGISLINLAEALDYADRIEITIVP